MNTYFRPKNLLWQSECYNHKNYGFIFAYSIYDIFFSLLKEFPNCSLKVTKRMGKCHFVNTFLFIILKTS